MSRALQLGRLVVLTQWSLGRYGWGRWHLCPANIERAIDAGELDVALCGARPRRGAPVREASLRGGPVPVGSLCPRCVGVGSGAVSAPTAAVPPQRQAPPLACTVGLEGDRLRICEAGTVAVRVLR